MTQICTYCDEEHDISDTVFTIISHGFGHANKEHKPFCSVECRVWWRRRCSDEPGEWEQPYTRGIQSRLHEFGDDESALEHADDEHDESDVKPVETASEAAIVEAEA